MPCRDYEDDNGYGFSSVQLDRLRSQNDRLARIACKAMTELAKDGRADFLLLADDEVREWWTAHLEADRKAQEELKRKREAAAAKAVKTRKRNELIARLTSEERELLGVKIKT